MTDETNPGLEPAAAAIPAETPEPVESATTPTETTTQPDDAGQPTEAERDERGRFTGAQKRIDELTRNWREAERREAALLAMLQQQQPPQPEPIATEPPKLPTLEEHGYDEGKYQAALLKYAADTARAEVQRELAAARQQEAQQRRIGTFAERQAAFAKSNPDYADLVLRDMTLPISDAMRDVIMDSDAGPEVAYYLARNRETAESIARLPPHLAARELGRIEAKLEAAKEAARRKPVPPVTQAPPPPPVIEATEAPPPEKNWSNMSDAEFAKWRRRQIAQRR